VTDSHSFRFHARARHAPNSLARQRCAQIFSRQKSGAATSCAAFAASPRMLSIGSRGLVHEFSDMDVMPISQWFLEFILERVRRARSRAMMRVSMSWSRVVAACRDAAGVSGYTFR
jgi:hypothetical protein